MMIFYSGLGHWLRPDILNPENLRGIALTGLVRETGLFELGIINSDEIEFSKKATVYYLKPTDEHEKGVEPPFIPNLGVLDIPYFELNEPINITDKDIFKENIEVKNSESQKKRKVLIENQRATTELLLLIYQIFNEYKLKAGVDDETKLPAIKAWGLILSRDFKSDLIQSIVGARDAALITLNGGDIINEADFKRTYTRRFK